VAVEVAHRQHEDAAEDIAAHPVDDMPADVTNEVGLGEVPGAAQDEQADHHERHPHDGARIAVRERPVAEFFGEQRKARHGEREQDRAQDPENELRAVGSDVAQQPAVSRQGGRVHADAGAGEDVPGLPAGAS
jgi:hypothetical protein